jgi:hypothetical protein
VPTSEPRFPAHFDPEPWAEDIARCTPAGRREAQTTRDDYEANGIPRSHLRPCEGEGRDGTMLANCHKVRVPHPDGKWGMVFTAIIVNGRPTMEFLAFGARHHPRDSNAMTVYQTAGRRRAGGDPA